MRFVFTRDNLSKLTPYNRPVIKDGKMVGVVDADEPKSYIVSDTSPKAPPGFCFYVGKKRRIFYIQVRVGKAVQKLPVGDDKKYEINASDPKADARIVASNIRSALKEGVSVKDLRKKERELIATTLGDVLDMYLRHYETGPKRRPNSIHAIKAAIKRLEPWSRLSIRAVGSGTVHEIWTTIAEKQKHKTAAEQTLMWCRAAFNVYIENQQANSNMAMSDKRKLVNPFNIARRYMRTRKDLEAAYEDRRVRNPVDNTPERLGVWLDTLWGLRQRNRDAVDYLLLTLLLGARKSETGKLVWRGNMLALGLDETLYSTLDIPVDGDMGQVTFRDTKSGVPHTVPLGRFATELMRMRRNDQPDSLYVFPASSTNPKTESEYYNSPREFVASFRSTLEKNSKDAAWRDFESKNGVQGPAARADFDARYQKQWVFTMHDLRRTFCTVAVNIEGMPYAVVQQLMNHGQLSNVTARYGKPTKESLRLYMQRLENELLRHATSIPKLAMDEGT